MGKMYTLKPDESINDHMKESISLLNRLAEIVKEAYKYLPEKDCTLETGVFLDIDSRAFYSALEHIRNTIEMLDELTDELENREDEVRREYEERVARFFNNWMNTDMSEEYKCRAEEVVKRVHEIENHYMSEIQKLNDELEQERERSNQLEHQLKEEHERYMKLRETKEDSPAYWKKQFERMQEKSNQLEKRCSELVRDRDEVVEYWEERTRKLTTKFELAKKLLHLRREEVSRLKEELRQIQIVKDAQKKVIDEKEKRCSELIRDRCDTVDHWTKHCEHLLQKHREELAAKDREIYELKSYGNCKSKLSSMYGYVDTDIAHMYPKTLINNPANFCGNCKYFHVHPNDVGMCENIYGRYSKVVDPDDASCQAFESNNGVVIDKPEFPCCDHCNHEDCDDCTLCPF